MNTTKIKIEFEIAATTGEFKVTGAEIGNVLAHEGILGLQKIDGLAALDVKIYSSMINPIDKIDEDVH
jgi:hypothetical protein